MVTSFQHVTVEFAGTAKQQKTASEVFGAMVAHANEIDAVTLERLEDLFERHLAIVRILAVTVEDPAKLPPAGVLRHGFAARTDSFPGFLLRREPYEVIVEGAAKPE
jgi:hypothetical protein